MDDKLKVQLASQIKFQAQLEAQIDPAYKPDPLFPSPAHKKLLLGVLKMLGGFRVQVSFAGGGDSGSIEDVRLLDIHDKKISLDNAVLRWPCKSDGYVGGEWKRYSKEADTPIESILTDLCYCALENIHLDWYNNEGGQGDLVIDLGSDPCTICLEMGINEMITHNHSFDFSDHPEGK